MNGISVVILFDFIAIGFTKSKGEQDATLLLLPIT
jgi:hypothetical protein